MTMAERGATTTMLMIAVVLMSLATLSSAATSAFRSTWLNYRVMANRLDTSDDCTTNYCIPLIKETFEQCNTTVFSKSLDPTNPPKSSDVKSILSKCICGADDNTAYLQALFVSCAQCYSVKLRSQTNSTFFTNACGCDDPAPVDVFMGATCKTKKLVDSLGNPAVFATTTTTVVRPTTTAAAVNGTRAAGPTGTGVPVVGALIHNNVVGAAVVGRPQPAEVKSSTSSWFGSLVPGRFRPGSRSATGSSRTESEVDGWWSRLKRRWTDIEW